MFKINAKVELGDIVGKVSKAVGFGQFVLDEAVIKDSNYYVPKDKGDLERSVLMNSKIGTGQLNWNTEYARKLYYNPQYNFSKDQNPNASGLWFEKAKAEKKQSWIEQANKATKSRL